DIELGGERNRGLYVLKSRGMAHSNQIREILITPHGVELADIYVGPEGALTGSMRAAQERKQKAVAIVRRQESERKQRERERNSKTLEAQIAARRAEFESAEEESRLVETQDESREEVLAEQKKDMARRRAADVNEVSSGPRRKVVKGD